MNFQLINLEILTRIKKQKYKKLRQILVQTLNQNINKQNNSINNTKITLNGL